MHNILLIILIKFQFGALIKGRLGALDWALGPRPTLNFTALLNSGKFRLLPFGQVNFLLIRLILSRLHTVFLPYLRQEKQAI